MAGDVRGIEGLYAKVARKQVEEYYKTIKDTRRKIALGEFNLVGLLTFPNSGTTWFLKLSQVATGIQNHTEYKEELLSNNINKSRGVYLNDSGGGRAPGYYEPSLVKSHVANFSNHERRLTRTKIADAYYSLVHKKRRWQKHLPPNCHCNIRIIRNPYDNIRSRYHHYQNHPSSRKEKKPVEFKKFIRRDLSAYLNWHHYCNEAALKFAIFTIQYSDLIGENREKAIRTLFEALKYGGYKINESDVRKAFEIHPPKYLQSGDLPVHLKHYDEEDIIWVADELKNWTAGFKR